MKRLTLILALALAAPSFASAQDTRRIELSYASTPRPCPRVGLAGPATGIAVSSLGIVASLPVTAVAADAGNTPGMLATGVSLAALSVAGLVTSSIFLHRKREQRRQHEQGRCEDLAFSPGVRF
jgi:hypothetical protein